LFPYEHRWPAVSAALSGLFFLLPALAVTSPLPQRLALSPRAFDHALTAILSVGAATIVTGALFNFRLVGLGEIYAFRGDSAKRCGSGDVTAKAGSRKSSPERAADTAGQRCS